MKQPIQEQMKESILAPALTPELLRIMIITLNYASQCQKHFEYLIGSIPKENQKKVLEQLESKAVIELSKSLLEDFTTDQIIQIHEKDSRLLFFALLKGVKDGLITAAQLATQHIMLNALYTFYKKPLIFTYYRLITETNNLQHDINAFEFPTADLPSNIFIYPYKHFYTITDITTQPPTETVYPPILKQYFNLTDSEWAHFCTEMENASTSEQNFFSYIIPESGCLSAFLDYLQTVINCVGPIKEYIGGRDGVHDQSRALAPSFSMLQAVINAKARTLGRKPVTLVPTYGYLPYERYKELKRSGQVAVALYLPEEEQALRYNNNVGDFRTTIDGHLKETAYIGALHDFYHALREMMMSENVARARMRLADLANDYPKNEDDIVPGRKYVEAVLVDGELIFSYSADKDTIFNAKRASRLHDKIFGDIFYAPSIRKLVTPELKTKFIADMVINKQLWRDEFDLGREDLLPQDQTIYDGIFSQQKDHKPSSASKSPQVELGIFRSAHQNPSSMSPPVPKTH